MCIKLKCIKAFLVQQINTKVAPSVSLVGVQLITLIVIQPFQCSPTISLQRHPPTPTSQQWGLMKKKKKGLSLLQETQKYFNRRSNQNSNEGEKKNPTYISNETFTAYLSAGCYGDGRTRTYILPICTRGSWCQQEQAALALQHFLTLVRSQYN